MKARAADRLPNLAVSILLLLEVRRWVVRARDSLACTSPNRTTSDQPDGTLRSSTRPTVLSASSQLQLTVPVEHCQKLNRPKAAAS